MLLYKPLSSMRVLDSSQDLTPVHSCIMCWYDFFFFIFFFSFYLLIYLYILLLLLCIIILAFVMARKPLSINPRAKTKATGNPNWPSHGLKLEKITGNVLPYIYWAVYSAFVNEISTIIYLGGWVVLWGRQWFSFGWL